VNEHDGPVGRHNDIGLARQIGAVEGKAETETMQNRTHKMFGRGVLAANGDMHLPCCKRFGPFGPNGATECSHGWSDAVFGVAQPVERSCFNIIRPDGAAELPERGTAQSNTYRSSNSTSCARSIRRSSDLKSSFL